MSAPDTRRSSAITDHPFEPRREVITRGPSSMTVRMLRPLEQRGRRDLQPSEYLCQHCGLAEAAHTETTVTKEAS